MNGAQRVILLIAALFFRRNAALSAFITSSRKL